MRYNFESGQFTDLAVTARKKAGGAGIAAGSVRLLAGSRMHADCYYKYNGYETYMLSLEPNTAYIIECLDIEISLAYAYCRGNLPADGVTYLVFDNETLRCYNKAAWNQRYCQSFRNRFHFSPFTGWMNDPNGLCWFQGYYHLFYQFNPNSDQWGNMHWGHAVSRDLLHWTHLPVVHYPQIELLDNPEFRGGAFSGSAIVAAGRMHLFFTRHFGKTDRSWQRQWQVTCYTDDGINFSPEVPCIWGTPEGVYYDFRDPKVMAYEDEWLMVLGGTCHHKPAVLWYRSADLRHWQYQGVLLEETDARYGIGECPDFFPLDGQYVLLVGYIYALPAAASRRDTKYYIGSFDGKFFIPHSEGLVDYGKDFYAAQTMAHEGRRIAIGWNTTADGIYVPQPGSANGTAGLPRTLSVNNGRLYSYPVAEVQSLHEETIFEGEIEAGLILPAGGAYCLEITGLQNTGGLSAILADGAADVLEFSLFEQRFCLRAGQKSVCSFPVEETVSDLTCYVDHSLIEIFINRGAYTCTRRFYLEQAQYIVKELMLNRGTGRVKLSRMKPVW